MYIGKVLGAMNVFEVNDVHDSLSSSERVADSLSSLSSASKTSNASFVGMPS